MTKLSSQDVKHVFFRRLQGWFSLFACFVCFLGCLLLALFL